MKQYKLEFTFWISGETTAIYEYEHNKHKIDRMAKYIKDANETRKNIHNNMKISVREVSEWETLEEIEF